MAHSTEIIEALKARNVVRLVTIDDIDVFYGHPDGHAEAGIFTYDECEDWFSPIPVSCRQTSERRFKEPSHQEAYDQLRAMRPDVEQYRGMGSGGNAYAVGYTAPDTPNRAFPRGSKAYAHWAAGVDNARDDRRAILQGEASR